MGILGEHFGILKIYMQLVIFLIGPVLKNITSMCFYYFEIKH